MPRADAGGFAFLSVLDWTRASGWDVLARAFAAEFGPDEDVSLVIRAWSSLGYAPFVIGEALLAELEDAGHDAEALPDIVLEVSAAHAAPHGDHLRGADCYVSPARLDDAGTHLLEAADCGLPVIATAWTAGAGSRVTHPLGGDPTPVGTLAAREHPHLDGSEWAEPDEAELRRHLRAVFEGRAPEAPARVPRPAPRGRPRRTSGARPEDVSFVVQGPVERGTTAQACAAIRRHFPGAEIVVSTWEGADTRLLDHDVLVESADVGGLGGSHYNGNTNRMIVSSLAGIRASTRPLVAKVRSDLLFTSDVLLSHWGRWEERTDELRLFKRRVLVPNVFTRRPSFLAPYPLHPSDWSFFGLRGDLETLFDVPLMRPRDSYADGVTGVGLLYATAKQAPACTPEQWIWTRALRRVAPGTGLRHAFEVTAETLRATELSFANNLAILDTYTQYGVWCPKYPWPNRVREDFTLYQHDQWHALYERDCLGLDAPADEAAEVLAGLARGERGTFEQAAQLRRAGLSHEAQLLECALTGPRRLRRDSTTGGPGRWLADLEVTKLAGRELATAARTARRPRRAAGAPA